MKGLTQDKFQAFSASGCLQIHFTAFGVFFGKEILTKNKTKWATGCSGLGLAVEMLGETAL